MSGPSSPKDGAPWREGSAGSDQTDGDTDRALDEIIALAKVACAVPIAVIALLPDPGRGFKASWFRVTLDGAPFTSICEQVLASGAPLVIPDATLDSRYAEHPLVIGPPHMRFYAGAPLISASGEPMGTLCVMDRVPRDLDPAQREALLMLGRQVTSQIELRRRVRELGETKALYRGIVELTPDAVFVHRHGRVEYINQAGLRLLGATAEQEVLGRPALGLFHPEHHELIRERIARLRERPGTEPWAERRMVALDGSLVDVEVAAASFFAGGELLIQVICRDLTTRRRSEHAARRLAAIVESTDDAIFSQDVNGRISSWNHGAEKTFGYRASEMIGGTIAKLLPADQVATVTAVRERVLRGERIESLEGPALHKDGRIIDLSVTLSPIRGEGDTVVGIAVIGRDIGERKRSDAALVESEARFRELAENIREVIWMTDPVKERILYVSPAYERIWGRSCESLRAAPTDWLNSVHPEERERVRVAVFTKQERGDFNETYRIERADGTLRWIHDRAFPVRDTAGTVRRIVGIAEDITEQRQLETQLRQAQKLEAIGQLAGGVAHDFNNILAALLVQAELVAADATLSPETAELIGEMKSAAERAAGLTRQLLAFSRRQVLVSQRLDVNELVDKIASMLRRILGEDVELGVELAPQPLFTRGDAGMLDQVVVNLAVNARDAMPDGGRLRIQVIEESLSPEAAARLLDVSPGRYVVVCVSDTGSGIAPEHLGRIFEPFFTTKGAGKGTGLGLATAFGIVKQHGGWISVESQPGLGTMFRVHLPVTDERDSQPHTLSPAIGAQVGTETILFVEDDAGVHKAIRAVLERAGYRVLAAANGAEALSLWAEHRGETQLLFTDIVMPGGMSGLQLAARLREDAPGLRVLFTSGYSVDLAGRTLSLKERRFFLQKPAPADQLLETIRRCLDE